MTTIDPYRLLQVHPEADAEIIGVAFRKLAQRYHPDVAPGPEAARLMAELNAARDLLLDPVARAAYDRSRTEPGDELAARRAAATGTSATPSRAGAGTPAGPIAGPPPGNPSGSVLSFRPLRGLVAGRGRAARRRVRGVARPDAHRAALPCRDRRAPSSCGSARRRRRARGAARPDSPALSHPEARDGAPVAGATWTPGERDRRNPRRRGRPAGRWAVRSRSRGADAWRRTPRPGRGAGGSASRGSS